MKINYNTIFSILKNSLKVQCLEKTYECFLCSSYHCSSGTDV